MRKFISIVLILCGLTVVGQEKDQRRASSNDDEMANLKAKRLSMQLDLNEEQQEKLKVFFAERMEANKEKREERQEMRENRMEMNDKQKAQLREILTDEQYQKWEGLMEKRRKGRKVKMKNEGY